MNSFTTSPIEELKRIKKQSAVDPVYLFETLEKSYRANIIKQKELTDSLNKMKEEFRPYEVEIDELRKEKDDIVMLITHLKQEIPKLLADESSKNDKIEELYKKSHPPEITDIIFELGEVNKELKNFENGLRELDIHYIVTKIGEQLDPKAINKIKKHFFGLVKGEVDPNFQIKKKRFS